MGFCWATLARTHPCDGLAILARDRSPLTFGRLATHLQETGAFLRRAGIGPADRVVSVLPHGPDAATAALAVSSVATFAPLDPEIARTEYTSLFLRLIPKVLLAPAGGQHPAKQAARSLRIPVLEVNRHFEAGVFTLDGRTAYAPAPDRPATLEDIALIVRFVQWTHASLRAAISCAVPSGLVDWHGLIEGVFTPVFYGGPVICGASQRLPAEAGSGTLKRAPQVLTEIDEALRMHPAVAEAVAFRSTRDEIAAAVSLHSGAPVTAHALLGYAATHLPAHKLPQRIFFVDSISELDRTRIAEPEPAEILPIRPGNGEVPLFIVAPRRISRRNLAGCLGADRAVFGICAPDLARLGQPHTIEHIAAECVRALRRFRPSGPYALGGWQADGVVAIEMARQLEMEGSEVEFVALFETRDQLLRRTTRLRRWLRRAGQLVRNCFRSKNARDAVAEGLRYYRSYPWHGRLLRVRNPVLVIGQPTRLSSPTQNPIPAPRRTVS